MEILSKSQSQNEELDIDTPVTAGILPTKNQLSRAADEKQHNSSIVTTWLLGKVPEFSRLTDLRRQGWENPAGDRFFQTQRRNADKTDKRTSQFHFRLMKRIGEELHNATMGLGTRTCPGSILDMCAAPGGFLATAMWINPDCEVVGFSLPPSDGGYNVLLQGEIKHCVMLLDITMLAADMGVTDIPERHPDAKKFLPRQLEKTKLFDLVICDGQVLRTHKREPYRETREPSRLATTQLALGLEHLKPRGTMVVLLHKVESWNTVCLLRRFSRFSTIKLYKPKAGHVRRSSFYMVATEVQSQHPEATFAIEKWKEVWRTATFGNDDEFADALNRGEQSAEELLEEFGPDLIRHGRDIWSVQADALAKAPFINKQ